MREENVSTSPVINSFFSSFITDDITETKRYQRHRDNCRKTLNDFIVSNFFMKSAELGVYDAMYGKNDEQEPLFILIRYGLMGHYDSLCNLLLSKSEEEFNIKKLGFSCLLGPHAHTPAFSEVENFMKKTLINYKDEFIKILDSTKEKTILDDLPIEIYKEIQANKDYKFAYAVEQLSNSNVKPLNLLCDKYPELDRFMDYIMTTNLTVDESTPTFVNIFNNTFNTLFLRFIKLKSCKPNINLDNYVTFTKFETDDEMLLFLFDLYALCKADAESVFSKILAIYSCKDMVKDAYEHIESSRQKADENLRKAFTSLEQADDEINELNSTINSQASEIAGLKKSKKDLEKNYLSQIADLTKQIKDLNKDKQDLQDKYDDLNSYTSLIENENIDDNEDVEIDTSKHYIFVSSKGTENYSTIRTIQETFPNSIVKFGNFNVPADSTDAVIFLTFYLEHSIYYDLKNQCKGKNIPIIHCSKRDITDIKRAIASINV